MTRVRKAAVLAGCLALVSPLFLTARPLPAAAADTDEAQIQQLERDRQDAFIRNDVDALDRDTAADYTTINGTGKLSTKPQMMENLRQGKTKVLSVKLEDLKARVYGETAALTGIYNDVNVRDGVQRETHSRFMRVFVKSGARWQAVAYQQTPIVDK
jgi:ketosteroid isomerase-like protein